MQDQGNPSNVKNKKARKDDVLVLNNNNNIQEYKDIKIKEE